MASTDSNLSDSPSQPAVVSTDSPSEEITTDIRSVLEKCGMEMNSESYGEGEPIVFVHGIGMSTHAFHPLVDILTKHKLQVIIVDMPGFGLSPRIPKPVLSSCENIGRVITFHLKHKYNITTPIHMVGNSMGGWIALDCAALGLVKSAFCISPGGLWSGDGNFPKYLHYMFVISRSILKYVPDCVLDVLLRIPLVREIGLRVSVGPGCWNMPYATARKIAHEFKYSPGFWATYFGNTRFSRKDEISETIPVSVCFGTHDILLAEGCQEKSALPAHAKFFAPKGWGHIPSWSHSEDLAQAIIDHLNM